MSTKSELETRLNKSQLQIIVNAWRMLEFDSFFMVSTCLEPFVNSEVCDELSFLTSVKYQIKHLIDKKMKIPCLSIGSDELGVRLGEVFRCKSCGEMHNVLYADETFPDGLKSSKLLAYYKCGGKEYICGVNGLSI